MSEKQSLEEFEAALHGAKVSNHFDAIRAIEEAGKRYVGEGCLVRPQPFGFQFAKEVPAHTADGTGTTGTVSGTIAIPPDTDTDPSDSD